MTAVPPRPAAGEVCRCGLPRATAVHGNPFGAGHAYEPRPSEAKRAYDEGRWCGECIYDVVMDPPCCTQPAAPDATAGDGLELQSQLYALLGGRTSTPLGAEWTHERLRRLVSDLLALPALRDVLAAAARDAEKATDSRNPQTCPRCGNWCVYDGWGHVHGNGLGIGSCKDGPS